MFSLTGKEQNNSNNASYSHTGANGAGYLSAGVNSGSTGRYPDSGSAYIEESAYENISLQSLFKKSRISARQKEVANNYMVIKKIFGFSAVNSRISNTETALLRQYGMHLLEETSARTMYNELETLIEWSKTGDALKRLHSDNIFEIRVKELKFLQANNSVLRLGELYNGYSVLEKYIEYLAG